MVYDFFEKAFLIPEEWEYPKFNEIVKTNPSTKIESKTVPYIPMDSVDIEKPNFNYTEERLLSENTSLAKFQDNDVLFARITPSTENGKTSFVENFKKKGIVSSELTVLRPSEKVFPKYLYYYMKSHKIRQFAISQMMGTTGRQRVPDFVFKKDLYFELPPLPEQQKIASILSNVDNLIQNTDKLIEKTTRLKKGLMQELLTRGIGHTKFKKVKWYFGKEIEIPEEWEVIKFRSMIKMEYGKGLAEEKRDNFGNPVYGSGGLIGLHSKPIVNGPGIIVARKGSLGNVFLENDDFFPIDTVYYITEKQTEIDLKFLFYYLLHIKLENLRIVTSKPGISREDVYSYRILSISFEEQQQIASILSNTDE